MAINIFASARRIINLPAPERIKPAVLAQPVTENIFLVTVLMVISGRMEVVLVFGDLYRKSGTMFAWRYFVQQRDLQREYGIGQNADCSCGL